MKRILFLYLCLMATVFGLHALEITRYVAQDATGDGLSKEKPTGDLKKVLDLSKDVDGLTIYLEPGEYNLPALTDVNSRTQYKNVLIYGGGCPEVKAAEQKSVITGDLYINGGAVLNVDFKGSEYRDKWSPDAIEGSLHVIGCNVFFTDATSLVAEAVPGQPLFLISTNAPSALIKNFRSGWQKADVSLWDCNFCDGYGATFADVKVTAYGCSFNDNKSSVGLSLNRCEGSNFVDCKILNNKGKGGVLIDDLTDNIDVTFDRCVISDNLTKDENFCSAVTTHAPIVMKSCLVAGNRSAVTGYPSSDNYRGAILLDRRQSKFINCTFYDNSTVFNYLMEVGDHQRVSGAQIWNCVFLKNYNPYWSRNGVKPVMAHCAADFGSDIPELDAERKMTRITAENAGMTVEYNIAVHLQPGSPLINAGLPENNLDLNGNSHQLLGATDLGCAEFTGEWEIFEPETTLTLYDGKYFKVKTQYQGKDFYAYVPECMIEEGKVTELSASLYCGNELRPLKKASDVVVTAYFRANGSNIAVLYKAEPSPWDTDGLWTVKQVETYTTTPPLPAEINKEWVLKTR